MAVVTTNLGTVTAYGDAVAAGYTGTKAQWQALMADYATVGQQAAQNAQTASTAATTATTAASTATTKASEASASATAAAASAASIGTPDTTLTQSGKAADAKATGDKISEIKEDFNGIKIITVNRNTSAWSNGYINSSTGEFVSSPTAITTDNYIQGGYVVQVDSGKSIAYAKYELDGTFVSRSNWMTTEQTLDTGYKYRLSMRTEPYSSGQNTSVDEYGKCQILEDVSTDKFIKSKFYGKKVSILGDSISTFTGYIPSENMTYYPTVRCQDMNSASQTWWKRVVDAFGMSLLVNNSYSGGRVAVAGNSAGRAIIRCDALDDGTHDPDIIFFFMGTNDFNTNVTIGTYDGTGDFPTESDSTFRASYAQVLKKMMTAYPLAEVYCMTILPCERMLDVGFPEKNERGTLNQYNDAIRELANLFNCKVLDVDKCGITYFNISSYMGDYNYPSTGQGLHPNGNGHKLIADYVIERLGV